MDVVLDNIGLPYSGINIAFSDTATVGPMDGEILIALKEEHTPTAAHVAELRRELPSQFPQMQFFFQPADIVNQVLNFGQPAPIDIRVTGPVQNDDYAMATQARPRVEARAGCGRLPRVSSPRRASLRINVDRRHRRNWSA